MRRRTAGTHASSRGKSGAGGVTPGILRATGAARCTACRAVPPCALSPGARGAANALQGACGRDGLRVYQAMQHAGQAAGACAGQRRGQVLPGCWRFGWMRAMPYMPLTRITTTTGRPCCATVADSCAARNCCETRAGFWKAPAEKEPRQGEAAVRAFSRAVHPRKSRAFKPRHWHGRPRNTDRIASCAIRSHSFRAAAHCVQCVGWTVATNPGFDSVL